MRCAAQSTSRQRSPSSSDWRRPVIAAARTTTRSTGPRTSGGGGGAGPRRPRRVGRRRADHDFVGNRPQHRLELVERQELQIGIGVAPGGDGRGGPHDARDSRAPSRDRSRARRSSAGSSARCESSSASRPFREHRARQRLRRGRSSRRRRPARRYEARCARAASTRSPPGRSGRAPPRRSFCRSESPTSSTVGDLRATNGLGRPLLGVLQAPKLSLGLRACQAVSAHRVANPPDLAIQLAPVERAPATVVGPRLLVQVPGAVSALVHRVLLYTACRLVGSADHWRTLSLPWRNTAPVLRPIRPACGRRTWPVFELIHPSDECVAPIADVAAEANVRDAMPASLRVHPRRRHAQQSGDLFGRE